MNQTVKPELKNPEMKAKYFSLHIGQTIVGHECDNCSFRLTEVSLIDCEVGLWGDWSGGTNPNLSCNDMIGIDAVWLNLKHLSSISDDDLIKCYHLHSALIGYDYTQDYAPTIHMARHWLKHDGINVFSKCGVLRDFARSLGYAVDWLNHSVQELMEAGYMKLREGGDTKCL